MNYDIIEILLKNLADNIKLMCFPVKKLHHNFTRHYLNGLSYSVVQGDICQTGNLIRNLQHKRGGKNEAWIDFSTRMKMIFFSKIVLTFCEKKLFGRSRMKILKFEVEGWEFKENWDHLNTLFKQWNGNAIFETKCFFNLFLEVSLKLKNNQN